MAHARRNDAIGEDDTTVHRGSGDFLADQGIKDPDEFRVKSHLCHTIASIMEARDLTQQQVADLAGHKQADISRIVNSRHAEYSVWRLMKILSALGADIGIMINVDSGNEQGVILSQTLEAAEEAIAPRMGP